MKTLDVFLKFAFLIIPLITVYVVDKRIKRFMRINALIWLINFVVFFAILGAELAIFKYYNAKKNGLLNASDDMGARFEPYNMPQENTEMK
jgi:hypothetical protein